MKGKREEREERKEKKKMFWCPLKAFLTHPIERCQRGLCWPKMLMLNLSERMLNILKFSCAKCCSFGIIFWFKVEDFFQSQLSSKLLSQNDLLCKILTVNFLSIYTFTLCLSSFSRFLCKWLRQHTRIGFPKPFHGWSSFGGK